MTLKTFVTFQSSSEVTEFHSENYEVLDTLGRREDALGVQLKDLLSSVTEEIQESIENEGELSIEVSGTIDLKASGGAGVPSLFFNVGAEAGKVNTMKITLKTKVTPKNLSS
jgi:hypothetical protein